MEQLPAVTKLRTPPLVIVQTPVVDELKVTVKPESDVAVNVGVVPKFCAPGLAKVMVWAALGITALEAAEATLVPLAFVAVTVKVYAVPLVKPLTVILQAAGPAQLPVAPLVLAVAV